MHTATTPQTTVRALSPQDLEAVVAIDEAILGRSRRDYFLRRLSTALKEPDQHVQLAAADAQGLAGFIMGNHGLRTRHDAAEHGDVALVHRGPGPVSNHMPIDVRILAGLGRS